MDSRNLELEKWKAWNLKSKKFGSTSLKVSTLFFFKNFGFGFGGCHCQFSIRPASPPFFLLFFKVGGCHYRVVAKSQAPSFSFFLIYVLLLLGVGGFHCQLLAPFFFHFFFASFWVPSPGLSKGGAPFFCYFFFLLRHHHQLLAQKELLFFFCFFLLFVRHHCQDSTRKELAPPFFIFLVASRAPWPSFGKRGV